MKVILFRIDLVIFSVFIRNCFEDFGVFVQNCSLDFRCFYSECFTTFWRILAQLFFGDRWSYPFERALPLTNLSHIFDFLPDSLFLKFKEEKKYEKWFR
jgi:hypothetical protein